MEAMDTMQEIYQRANEAALAAHGQTDPDPAEDEAQRGPRRLHCPVCGRAFRVPRRFEGRTMSGEFNCQRCESRLLLTAAKAGEHWQLLFDPGDMT